MDSYNSDFDLVPSTPEDVKTRKSAYSEYRTPKMASNTSSSSDETDKSLDLQSSLSFADSLAVVEESDIEGTPVASGKNKNLQFTPSNERHDNHSVSDSPVSGHESDDYSGSDSSGSRLNSDTHSTSNSPVNRRNSDADSTSDSPVSRRDSDSPIKIRKNTARKVIDSDESDSEAGAEGSDLIEKQQEDVVPDVFEEPVQEETSEQPIQIEDNISVTQSPKEAPTADEDEIHEVAVVTSESKKGNISTISIGSTSSEFSDDDEPLQNPQTPQSADQSIEEIPSPSGNIPPPAEVGRVLSEIRRSLDNKRSLLKSINPRHLPDGGAKIKNQIRQLEEELAKAERLHSLSSSQHPKPAASNAVSSQPMSQAQTELLRQQLQMKKWALGSATGDQRAKLRSDIADMERQLNEVAISSLKTYSRIPLVNKEKEPAIKLLPEAERLTDVRRMYAEQPTDRELYTKGRQTAAQKREAVSVTLDALQNLHSSLATCPTERDTEPTPEALTVPLLPHQTRALKWLLWRENQVPAGGILADDMGLGKTLTMISLIVKQRELGEGTAEVKDVWLTKELKIKKTSSTLIVCPASVIGQWENEIIRRTRRNTLSILTYHGPDRHKQASKLYKSDVVLTTYQIITREISNIAVGKGDDMGPIGDFNEETHAKEIRQSPLLQVAWERIILDEAHTIRNPKAQVSQAVCRLRAARRWIVTGTPVQNKELDMYALLRFLRVSPFDQLAVWKRWVDCKSAQGTERLNLLIKTLLLRRTKDQKMEDTGAPLVKMPSRQVHTHQIKLSTEENQVYQKILDFSRRALEQYIKKQENKGHDDWKYDQSGKSDEKAAKAPKDMTKHHLLVLLLRLRQACSHPALIKTMLDSTETESIGSDAKIEESDDLDLISQLASMNIDGNKNEQKEEEETNFFTLSNPVFKTTNTSSKMKNVIDEVQRVISKGQKVVIVSQWTSMLDVFDTHFQHLNIRCHRIAGNVNVKQRTAFVEDFNTNPKGPPVMLLSLAAGGVGLNLIGGNHLFLTDMHWNPQLEAQACDRVYRVGQLKDVHVHRFVTVGTVEERITELQKRKLELASGILTGAQNVAAKGLTLEDLKMLFNPSPVYRPTLSSVSGM